MKDSKKLLAAARFVRRVAILCCTQVSVGVPIVLPALRSAPSIACVCVCVRTGLCADCNASLQLVSATNVRKIYRSCTNVIDNNC